MIFVAKQLSNRHGLRQKSWNNFVLPQHPSRKEISRCSTVICLRLQQNARGNWRHWNDFIKGTTVPITSKISEILVPTMDTVRYTYLMELCITYTKYVACNSVFQKLNWFVPLHIARTEKPKECQATSWDLFLRRIDVKRCLNEFGERMSCAVRTGDVLHSLLWAC